MKIKEYSVYKYSKKVPAVSAGLGGLAVHILVARLLCHVAGRLRRLNSDGFRNGAKKAETPTLATAWKA